MFWSQFFGLGPRLQFFSLQTTKNDFFAKKSFDLFSRPKMTLKWNQHDLKMGPSTPVMEKKLYEQIFNFDFLCYL